MACVIFKLTRLQQQELSDIVQETNQEHLGNVSQTKPGQKSGNPRHSIAVQGHSPTDSLWIPKHLAHSNSQHHRSKGARAETKNRGLNPMARPLPGEERRIGQPKNLSRQQGRHFKHIANFIEVKARIIEQRRETSGWTRQRFEVSPLRQARSR